MNKKTASQLSFESSNKAPRNPIHNFLEKRSRKNGTFGIGD